MRRLIPSDTCQRHVSGFQGEKTQPVELIGEKGVLKKNDEPSIFLIMLDSKLRNRLKYITYRWKLSCSYQFVFFILFI